MPIAPPNPHLKRTLARKVFNGGLSSVPVLGGALSGFYSMTHPTKSELEIVKWREDMCAAYNSQEKRIDHVMGVIPLSDDAMEIGFYFAEHAATGRSDIFTYEQVAEAFQEASPLELQEALGLLENATLISLTSVIGKPIYTIRLRHRLHEIFDPLVFDGVNPREDAAAIANRILSVQQMISTEQIMKENDWTQRRMNPALQIVGEMVGDGRKSTPSGPGLVIRAITANPSERATLRSFVGSIEAEH